MTEITVTRWNSFSKKDQAPIVLAIGQRGTGKTQLLNHLLRLLKVEQGMVISPTLEFEQWPYQGLSHHSSFFEPETMKKALQEAVALPASPYALVLDNAMNNTDFNNQHYRKLVYSSRYVNCAILQAVQDPREIPVDIRSNLDYVFMGKTTHKATLKHLWDNYAAGVVSTFEAFSGIMKQLDRYTFLVVDNTRPTIPTLGMFWLDPHMLGK